ncbi:MAG: hypothetical protein E3J90_09265 [Promethearchaeota archaeon]|nr:MAG: hypothetical protein E3J90_09265 [Candidatus Lokiarchaeota archaeon]
MDFGSEIKGDVGYLDEQKEEDEEKTEDDIPEIISDSDELDDDLPEDSDTDKKYDFDPSLDFSKIDDNAFDPSLDFSKIDDNDFDPSLDFSKVDDNDFDPSLNFNENEGKLVQNEHGKELEPNQAEPNEYSTEVSSEQFDPNESENSEEKEEFNPNSPDEEIEAEQFDPNEGSENSNESDQSEMIGDDESTYDPYEYGDNFEQEEYSGGIYENSYAESMNTILLSENQIYEYLQEYMRLFVEKEHEVKQGEQADTDNPKEEVSELEKFLEAERERIRLEQQQAGLDEITHPESESVANEEEVEQDQEEEVKIQENNSEEAFSKNEDEGENLEMEVKEILQPTLPNESVENNEFEEIEEKNEKSQLNGNKEKIHNLELDGKKIEGYKQYRFEAPEDEDEIELTVHDEELEITKEEYMEKKDHEEFIEEGELSQNKQELEVKNEIKSNETETLNIDKKEEELEREANSPYREEKCREIEENIDPQQELEEILEQNRKIEQQILLEIEKEEFNSNFLFKKDYETAKELYRKETGKRPIYANRETKGFAEWLEQNNESEENLKREQPEEQKVEQKEEKEWIFFLKNWMKEESEEIINPQMKNQLNQIIEKYNELDELTKSFKELYNKMKLRQLSQTEIMKFEILIKILQKSDPSNILLFTNLRSIKNYLTRQKLDETQKNHMLNHFFTQFPPIKQLNYVLTQKLQVVPDIDIKFEKSTTEEISKDQTLKNWKEVLKENLYKITMFSLNEKSIIIKIIKKAKLDEDDKKQLISILSKLPTEDLNSLLGNDFENHTRNYVKWGWDYDLGLKRLMLKEFLKRMNISYRDINNSFDVKAHGKTEKIDTETPFYSVAEFFRDLKKEIRRITGQKITYRTLSKNFLKMKNKWVINDKILHSKGNPDYVIDGILLSSYERTIKSKLGKNFSRLKLFFDRYKSINLNNRSKSSYNDHPNMDITYYKKIDSKQKAYWLGWLFAESHLSRKFLRVQIGVKDGILIKRFIEDLALNPRKVYFFRRYNSKSRKYSLVWSIKIINNIFRNHLINLGFPVGKKSDIIRFPNFSNPLFASIGIKKELEMAFVLGFFDGDGTHGSRANGKPNTPVITSKSQKFLQDIVEKFNLSSYITPKPKYDKEGKFQGYYYLGIGAKFFMSLSDNYDRSLPRKRVVYSKFYGKFLFTRDELQKIVRNNPFISSKEIVDLHNKLKGIKISERTVSDKINGWKIEKLSRDECYRQKTIELRLKGWSLKRIYEKEFKFKNWGTYSKIFFRRIFKKDPLVSKSKRDIHKKIEEVYKPAKVDKSLNKM